MSHRQTPTSGRASVPFFIFLLSLFFFLRPALAAFQNVTVDDAVLTGPVVPQYLPNASSWNVGNNCSVCFVQPDPAFAYNHTWHDTTLFPGNGISQALQFSFNGSALYVFFILANNLTGTTTTTDLDFVLDGAPVGTYTHNPAATTDYDYNVPVYTNASLDAGAHTMLIQPVASGQQILMLFDYLIYTTGTSDSASSPGTGATLSPNIAAIVGGTVSGVAAVLFAAASLVYYRRYRRRHGRPLEEGAVVTPFTSTRETHPASASHLGIETASPRSSPFGLPFETTLHGSKRVATALTSISAPTSLPPSTALSTASGPDRASASDLPGLVEMLRNEVARLRHLQETDTAMRTPLGDVPFEAPPEYS